MTNPTPTATPDAVPGNWVEAMPGFTRGYLRLARADRPVGTWLLLIPCWWGLALAAAAGHAGLHLFYYAALMSIGAFVMRGAGCAYNDIVDRDIDAQVERTALRPIPSGQVSVTRASMFLIALSLIGLVILLQFNRFTIWLGLGSLILVAIYPFMKRVTWWPQAWLGATFNWGVLVGVATAGTVGVPAIILYVGLGCWTVAYDTIYALQDREDDALIGVKSTARLFGKHAVLYSFCFFILAAALIAAASAMQGAGRMGAITSLAFLAHATAQVSRLKSKGEGAALAVFKSNVWTGALVAVGFTLAAMIPAPKPSTIFSEPDIVPHGKPEKVSLPFGLELKTGTHRGGLPETWLASDIRRTLERDGYVFPNATETEPKPDK